MRDARRYDRDLPVRWRQCLPLIGLVPLAALLEWVAGRAPAVVERVYSESAYPILLRSIGACTGWFPFSLAEVVLVLLAVLLGIVALRTTADLLRRRRTISNVVVRGVVEGLAAVGILFAAGVILSGLNYQRIPFAERAGLDTRPAAAAELRSLCERLVSEANELRQHVDEDERGVMRLRDAPREALTRATFGFQRCGSMYPVLDGLPAVRAKRAITPLLSAIGLRGLFCPYTEEAIVDMGTPPANLPHTVCHELAHQLGFAREGEASYIAYLACRLHPDPDFRYSGALEALTYSLSVLARVDPRTYREIFPRIGAGVRRDWNASSSFWERRRVVSRPTFDRALDAYLKLGGETMGVKSYEGIVGVLIAEQRARNAGGLKGSAVQRRRE